MNAAQRTIVSTSLLIVGALVGALFLLIVTIAIVQRFTIRDDQGWFLLGLFGVGFVAVTAGLYVRAGGKP